MTAKPFRPHRNGMSLTEIVSGLLHATDPDAAVDAASATTGLEDPTESAVSQARDKLLEAATLPLASNPTLRQSLTHLRRSDDQVIDEISKDTVDGEVPEDLGLEDAEGWGSSWRRSAALIRATSLAGENGLTGSAVAFTLRVRIGG